MIGVERAEARALYEKACDGGEPRACLAAAAKNDRGEGGPQDKVRARTLFKQGCDAGSQAGCENLKALP